MRKMILIALVAFISVSANAQLANSKWKGVLVLDSPVEVIFDFKTDTLEAIVAADNSSLELMQYSIKDSILTIQKISGQSSCASTDAATYKFEMTENAFVLTLIKDDCDDRSSVLNGTEWKKQ